VKAGNPPVGESGVILSPNHDPVPFASIQNHRTGAWTISNENGVFWIPNGTVNGDSLHIGRIGMKNKILVFSGKFLSVLLMNDPIHFPEITIHNNSIVHLKKPLSGSTRNELVNSLPGSILRSYGGSAGIAQAAVDGGRTMDVKVLFGGIDLTNPQNGLTDLSQLPSQYLGFSKLYENKYLTNGSGSTDGVIHFNPWSHPTGIQIQSGTGGTRSASVHFSREWSDFSFNMTTGKNTDPGTHPVLSKSESVERLNQDFDQFFSGFRFEMKKNQWIGHLSSWYSVQDRGISGLIWSPNSEANRKDTLSLFSTSLVRLLPKGFLKTTVTFRESGENYIDPNLSIDSDHFANTLSTNFSGHYTANSNVIVRFNSGFAREKVTSTDADDHKRDLYFFAPSLTVSHLAGFSILTAMRLDQYSDFGIAWTYSGELGRNILPWISLSGSWGSSFRAPTFNDLFWNPGGNPDLGPEQSIFGKFSAQFTLSKLSVELSSKKTNSTDLIVWESTGDFWRPENVNETTRKILGINGQIFFSKGLIFQSSIRHIQSENLSTGTSLRYSPNWISNGIIRIMKWDWTTSLSFHFTGTQIVMYNYPDNVTLDPTIMSHLSIEVPPIFHNQIRFNLSVSNFLNRETMTIYGYPEPSRITRINISYQIKKR